MNSNPELSVVVPSYNEEKNIPLILKRFAEAKGGVNMELVLVNNGSTDGSQLVLDEYLKKPEFNFARTVLVQKNIGYGYGVHTGLKACQAPVISYTHADMQCDPKDVIRAYEKYKECGTEPKVLVKGKRVSRKIIPFIITSLFHILGTILFFRVFRDINGQPKLFHKSLLNELTYASNGFQFDFFILYKALKLKMKVVNIPVIFSERVHGESKWDFSALSKVKNFKNFVGYMLKLRFLGEEKSDYL